MVSGDGDGEGGRVRVRVRVRARVGVRVRVVARAVDDVHQQAAALRVPQEGAPQPAALMRPLEQSGDVGQHQPLVGVKVRVGVRA